MPLAAPVTSAAFPAMDRLSFVSRAMARRIGSAAVPPATPRVNGRFVRVRRREGEDVGGAVEPLVSPT